MASMKAEKPIGTQLFGQAKKDPAGASSKASASKPAAAKAPASKPAPKKAAQKAQDPKRKAAGGAKPAQKKQT